MKNNAFRFAAVSASFALESRISDSRLSMASLMVVFAAMFVAGNSPARADIQFARGALSLTTALDVEYDSNIFSNQFRSADWHTVFSPAGRVVRDAGLVRIEAKSGVNFQRFETHRDQDSVDPFVQASARWMEEESKFDGSFEASYRRISEANIDVNTRTRYDDYDLTAEFGYFPFEKLGYRFNADYRDQLYLTSGLSDLRTTAFGVEGRYHYSPKIDTFLGLGGRWSDTHNVPAMLPSMDSTDASVEFGFNGDIYSKLSGRIAVGWVRRMFQSEIGGRQSGVTFDTALVWRVDDETSLTVLVNRDLDTTPVDESVMRLTTGIVVRREIHEKLNVNAGLSHMASNYIGVGVSRRDRTNAVQLGADYTFTKRAKLGVHLSYASTDSNFAFADYSRFIGGANLTISF